jgi:two-component system sensor histidine kinase VanS
LSKQFVVWVAVFSVVLALLFEVVKAFGRSKIWQPGPLYDFLYLLLRNSTELLILCWSIGFILIFIMFWFKTRESRRTAKDAEQRKNDMIVYLAHDLKTPLTSVIGYLTLLKDEQNISMSSLI